MAFPLSKVLRRLFTSYSFFFLGCSLSADRTIQTFFRVAGELGGDSLPHHYALLACPSEAAKKRVLDQRLADATRAGPSPTPSRGKRRTASSCW